MIAVQLGKKMGAKVIAVSKNQWVIEDFGRDSNYTGVPEPTITSLRSCSMEKSGDIDRFPFAPISIDKSVPTVMDPVIRVSTKIF
jgi:hypothetical protein